MTRKQTSELALSFATYLEAVRVSSNIDSAECANLATEMVKHLINTFPSVKREMYWNGDYEILEGIGIKRQIN